MENRMVVSKETKKILDFIQGKKIEFDKLGDAKANEGNLEEMSLNYEKCNLCQDILNFIVKTYRESDGE